ncbi:peptide ABC transporter substrate-binding protein [Oceanivirga salmonicida]|uniref:peptide ABC transporter substrate-binding protein n=1 Tax=Oceanivirga salmonicida TaxID=1769291 RepID=UPI0008307F67|nr:peptide ABC transporter substrate-binding protein [Oceanivirga salmonicida]
MFKKRKNIILIILGLFIVLFPIFYTNLKNKMNKNNEIVTYNIYSKPNTIDPHQFRDMLAVQLMNTVYEGLLRQDENQNFIPALAKSFEEKSNILTFEIREDAKYSDGTKVTIDDIINGFRRALNPKTAARYSEMLFPIKNAKKYNKGEATNDELGVQNVNGKLVITLEKPTPYFKYVLTLPISFPVKEKFVDDIEDYTKALYNGPYIISSMNDDEIILTKNKYYWDNKNVQLNKVKFVALSDSFVIENLIKNEELDITSVDPIDIETKKKNNELFSYSNGRIWYLEFNLANEILNDKENRHIISESINRKKYIKDIREDDSIIAKSVISDLLGDYRKLHPDDTYLKDDIKSDKLKGKKIRLLTGNSTSEVKEANFLQEELRIKLGLEVEVLTVTFKDRLALTRSGDFDIVLNTYSPKHDDPLTILHRWYRPNKPSYNAWRKEEYINLIDKIENETDTKKRYEYINKAERILVDDAIIAPLFYSVENWFIRKNLKNIIVHPISNTMDIHKIKR